jgi:hypothetical protein
MIPAMKEFNIVEAMEPVHQALMKESPMYCYAVEHKLAALICRMQLNYVEKMIGDTTHDGTEVAST